LTLSGLTGWYAVGADWVKEKDKTVIVVARVDEKPWVIEYLRAVNRKLWPEMVGRARTVLLVEYITAVERGIYVLPANTPAFAAHKGTTVEEVYAPGKWNSHLSDDVAAFALAHNAADRQAPPDAGEGVPKTAYVSRSQRQLTYGPNEPTLLSVGDKVRVVEEEMNPYVIS
jgi:hypothetical protein